MLRRKGSQAGGLALLCAVLVLPAQAATPSPDPPPLAVAPEPPQARKQPPVTQPSPVRRAPVVVAPSLVVRPQAVRSVPAATTVAKPRPSARQQAKPKPPVARQEAKPVAERRVPPDRPRVPLAAFVPAADELDRGLLALAGGVLAFVALGGAVMLVAARRQLGVAS